MTIVVFKIDPSGLGIVQKKVRVSIDAAHYFHMVGDEFSFEADAKEPTVREFIEWLKMVLKIKNRNVDSRRKWELKCVDKIKNGVLPVLEKCDKAHFVEVF